MKQLLIISGVLFIAACGSGNKIIRSSATLKQQAHLPAGISGNFKDDYGSTYQIDNHTLIQQPGNRYQLLLCDTINKFIIARNDASNKSEAGLFTRIDYMFFSGLEPWSWGYCLTVYNAVSDSAALAAPAADRNNPRKGCNGFPFTRMQRSPDKQP